MPGFKKFTDSNRAALCRTLSGVKCHPPPDAEGSALFTSPLAVHFQATGTAVIAIPTASVLARIGANRSLRIVISVQGLSEPVSCDGETITVNRQGALIVSGIPLHIEVKIEILVIRTAQRANAKVIYVDPDRPRVCGIALEKPENIWGVIVPPDDWYEE